MIKTAQLNLAVKRHYFRQQFKFHRSRKNQNIAWYIWYTGARGKRFWGNTATTKPHNSLSCIIADTIKGKFDK